jgi:hypothetical protein
MSRTAPLARQRRTPPLSNAWFEVPMSASDEFAPSWFASTHRVASPADRAHAPTRFVERRRHPRQPGASLGRLLDSPSMRAAAGRVDGSSGAMPAMGGVSHGGTWMPPLVAAAPAARPVTTMRSGDGGDRPGTALGAGLRGVFARVERLLDRMLPSPLVTLLQLFVCISLAMAVMSLMLPLLDLR